MPAEQASVEPCFRCGQPAELPVVGEGVVAGREEVHLPLCQDCLQLRQEDAERFWQPLRARRGKVEARNGPDAKCRETAADRRLG